MRQYFNPDEFPRISSDSICREGPDYSEDVFIIDEDGMHGIAFYQFEDKKWHFHTDTLVDYFEPGNETKWKWYYPDATVEEAFKTV